MRISPLAVEAEGEGVSVCYLARRNSILQCRPVGRIVLYYEINKYWPKTFARTTQSGATMAVIKAAEK